MEKEILYRYFEGLASREEEDAIYHWLDVSPANKEELFREREFFDAMIMAGGVEDHKMMRQGKQKRPGIPLMRSVVREVLKVAAVVAITVACGFYFHLSDKKDLLSVMNTIYVPTGQRVNLKLPDGTSVWLNACTEIVYPAVFSGGKREVQLSGEAYFDVVHNAESPFVVLTEKCNIEVLGTKFNVEAYPESDRFATALMEGSVKVTDNARLSHPVVLEPDQVVSVKDGQLLVSPINDYDYFRWWEGLVCFKNEDFKELMMRFEKCYGISIVVENAHLDDYTCTGKFRLSDGVDNALRILQQEAGYTFERNEDNSIIYIK